MTIDLDIRFEFETSAPDRKMYRVFTDREIFENKVIVPGHGQFYHASGPDWRDGMPAVFWLFNGARLDFTKEQQILSWDLVKGVMNKKQWRVVYDYMRAFMNGTGFDKPGEPKRDYITPQDLTAPLPEWDKIRVCANAIITGVEVGDMLEVDTITPDNIPTVDTIEQYHKFEAVSSTKTGDTTPFPQGGGKPVYIPLIASTAVKFPLSALERL